MHAGRRTHKHTRARARVHTHTCARTRMRACTLVLKVSPPFKENIPSDGVKEVVYKTLRPMG